MAKQRFTPGQNLGKRNIEKVQDNRPAVYKLLNQSGENIYTGVAKRGRVQERLGEHLPGGSDPIPGARSFTIKPKPSIEAANAEEKRIIRQDQPNQNEQGK